MTTNKKSTQGRASEAPSKKRGSTAKKASNATRARRKKERPKAAEARRGDPSEKKTDSKAAQARTGGAEKKKTSAKAAQARAGNAEKKKTSAKAEGSAKQRKRRRSKKRTTAPQNDARTRPEAETTNRAPAEPSATDSSHAARPTRPPSDESSPSAASPPGNLDPEVVEQIRALEARLGGMIGESGDDEPPPSLREQVTFAAREVVDRLAAPVERPGQDDGGVVDAVRGLLSSDYYLRQWGRIGMRNRSEEVDDFGLDPVYEQRLRPLWDFLYKRYFRVEAEGAENVPDTGRCLIVANHSGTIPLDGLMLRACLRLEHPSGRELRWLAEDFIYHLPFVGAFMSRVGAVRACQENAQRLLRKESLVAVFPEGVKGIGKLYRDRYQLQRFGRGGFVRLCLRMGAPIIPCAVVGAEESSPMLYRDEFLSRALGLPYLPITPTFPWLGPAGLIPAPTKWRIAFGELMDFSEYGPSAAEDNVLVGRLAERVRTTIQQTLDRAVSERRSVWRG